MLCGRWAPGGTSIGRSRHPSALPSVARCNSCCHRQPPALSRRWQPQAMVLAAAVAAPVAVRPSQHSFQARLRRAPRSVQAEQGGRSQLRAFPRPLGSLHACGDHARLPDWRGAGPRYGCGTAAAAAAAALLLGSRSGAPTNWPSFPLRACCAGWLCGPSMRLWPLTCRQS